MAEKIEFIIGAKETASKAFTKVSASMKVGVDVAKKLAASASAAGGAVLGFTSIVAAQIDKQGKFADRIGVSVEQLTKMQHVADLAGISSEQFNMATQRMTRRVAEAAQGMGEAQGALQELGINAQEFKGLGLEDQMATLSGAMEGVTDESDKLRLAFKLFDSEGTSMLQMLNGGSDAMKAAARDAQFLGLAIGEQAAAQAALFNDKMARATGSIKGLSNAVAQKTMPIIAGLADRFANFIAKNRTNIVNFVQDAIKGFTMFGLLVGDVFNDVYEVFTDASAFTQFLTNIKELVAKVGEAGLAMGKVLIIGLRDAFIIAKDIILAFGGWAFDAIRNIFAGETTDSISVVISQAFADGMARSRDNVANVMEGMSGVVGEFAPQIKEQFAESFGINWEELSERATAAIENVSLFAEAASENIDANVVKTSEFINSLQESTQNFYSWLGQNSKQFTKNLETTMKATITNLSKSLATAITSGTSLFQAFKDVAKQAITQVIASLIQLGIQRLLLSKTMTSTVMFESLLEGGKAIALAGVNMFKSMAAAPFPLNLTAPAVAAGAVLGARALFRSNSGGVTVAHGGLTNNPEEQTALILKNERIVSPRQNEDLLGAIDTIEELPNMVGSGGGGGVAVENIDMNIIMFPNVTDSTGINDLTSDDFADEFGSKIIDALNSLNDRGIRPDFVAEAG